MGSPVLLAFEKQIDVPTAFVTDHTFGEQTYASTAGWEVVGTGSGAYYRWQFNTTILLLLDEYVATVDAFNVAFDTNKPDILADVMPGWEYRSGGTAACGVQGKLLYPPSAGTLRRADITAGSIDFWGGGLYERVCQIERVPGSSTYWRKRFSIDGGSTWGSWSTTTAGTLVADEKFALSIYISGYMETAKYSGGVLISPVPWTPEVSVTVAPVSVSASWTEDVPSYPERSKIVVAMEDSGDARSQIAVAVLPAGVAV